MLQRDPRTSCWDTAVSISLGWELPRAADVGYNIFQAQLEQADNLRILAPLQDIVLTQLFFQGAPRRTSFRDRHLRRLDQKRRARQGGRHFPENGRHQGHTQQDLLQGGWAFDIVIPSLLSPATLV